MIYRCTDEAIANGYLKLNLKLLSIGMGVPVPAELCLKDEDGLVVFPSTF